MKFQDMELIPELLAAVKKMGFEEATPIQSETIPAALTGRDVLGQAQTGTGKTAAFGLPLLQKVNKENKAVQALVIAPTRELAVQTGEELFRLGREKGVRTTTVYGGANIGSQITQLKKNPDVVIGTPGRLLDLIKRGALKLNNVETLVLDEADEMLNMGFIEDIESIISAVPSSRQTLLFSATMPKAIQSIGERFMENPVTVKIKSQQMTANLIDQYYTKVKDFEKFDLLTRFIDIQSPDLSIVFARTKRRVDEVTRGLTERGYQAEGIHGDLNQGKRMSVLKDFKAGRVDILVATDVAARGLDVSGVTHVYNFDIPQDPESYVHRVGRTGRAGKEGMAVTFVIPNEMGYLRTIEKLTKKPMTPLNPPTPEEAFTGQMKHSVDQVDELVKVKDTSQYQEAVQYLLDKYTSNQLAMALLRTLTKDPSDIEVKITPERPLSSRGGNGGGGKGRGGNRGRDSRNNKGGRGGYNKDNKGGSRGSNRSSQGGNGGNRSSQSRSRSKSDSKGGSGYTIR